MRTIHIKNFASLSAIRKQRRDEGLPFGGEYLIAPVADLNLDAMRELPGFIPVGEIGTWNGSISSDIRPHVIGLCEGMVFVPAHLIHNNDR